MATVVIAAVIILATVAVISFSGASGRPARQSESAGPNLSCNQPAYLTSLVSLVEGTQSFVQQSHGLSYVLAYGDNESAETGYATVSGVREQLSYPPRTSLALYSYGTGTTTGCPSTLGTKGVVGALWIQVPLGSDGAYNLTGMSIYFTPGVFSNSTETSSLATSTSSATSATCVISAEGTGFYVTVLSDSGQPVQGVQVSGIRVTETNEGICTQTVGAYLTNSTGSVLITPNIGSYYNLTVRYGGRTYAAQAPIEPMQTTYVTLRVPSGNVTITEVPFGGCQRTTQSTTCPG